MNSVCIYNKYLQIFFMITDQLPSIKHCQVKFMNRVNRMSHKKGLNFISNCLLLAGKKFTLAGKLHTKFYPSSVHSIRRQTVISATHLSRPCLCFALNVCPFEFVLNSKFLIINILLFSIINILSASTYSLANGACRTSSVTVYTKGCTDPRLVH